MIANQDLLDGEMGTPPPSTVDIDRVIVRQRRRVVLRQAGLFGSVGAMTLAIGLVLIVLRGAGGDPNQIGNPGPPATTPPTPRAAEASRLTAELTRLLTAALPGAEFLPPEPGSGEPVEPTEALVFVDEETYFLAAARIRDAKGTGTITVTVGKEDTQFRSERACSTDPAPQDMRVNCEVRPGVDGAKTEVVDNSSKYSDYAFHRAQIIRADGNGVSVTISNATQNQEVIRPGVQLTVEQTVTLAEAPELATTLP